jgi:hypothetical protein
MRDVWRVAKRPIPDVIVKSGGDDFQFGKAVIPQEVFHSSFEW